MTFEKKCFIEPGDVLTINLECNKCLASITIPASALLGNRLTEAIKEKCSQCGERWGLDAETSEINTFSKFHEYLGLMRKMLEGGRHFKYRLGIKCPSD